MRLVFGLLALLVLVAPISPSFGSHGDCPWPCPEDIDRDGTVKGSDLGFVLNWLNHAVAQPTAPTPREDGLVSVADQYFVNLDPTNCVFGGNWDACVQAAADSDHPGIWFPEGWKGKLSTITISRRTIIRCAAWHEMGEPTGSFRGPIIEQVAGTNAPMFDVEPPTPTEFIHWFKASDCHLSGHGDDTKTNAHGIRFSGWSGNGAIIENMHISNFGGAGIYLPCGATPFFARDNVHFGNGLEGVRFGPHADCPNGGFRKIRHVTLSGINGDNNGSAVPGGGSLIGFQNVGWHLDAESVSIIGTYGEPGIDNVQCSLVRFTDSRPVADIRGMSFLHSSVPSTYCDSAAGGFSAIRNDGNLYSLGVQGEYSGVSIGQSARSGVDCTYLDEKTSRCDPDTQHAGGL